MFELVYGSAFDIAGEGVANPIGTIRSWELLFAHLGEDELAAELRDVVAEQLADSGAPRTPDIGGDSGSEAVADDLRRRIV